MEVHFTHEQETKLLEAAQSRGRGAEQLVAEVIERFLLEEEHGIKELCAAIDEADADIGAGHYSDYGDDALHALFEDVKQRGITAFNQAKASK
jgi:hypothetical protein